jgi:hypothetical protein
MFVLDNMIISVFIGENEENLAKVVSDNGEQLSVSFLSSSGKSYKGARVYLFETETEKVEYKHVIKQYETVQEFGFVELQRGGFVAEDEIDEDSESEVETDEDEDDEVEYDEEGFIVPDDEEVLIKPVDHKEVDKNWKKWRPTSSGAQRFKDKIDQIEAYMNHAIDEKFVFKN